MKRLIAGEPSDRFDSVESALRFYFRAEEILTTKASLQLHSEGQIPETGINRRENVMLDFLSVGACLKGLNELQRWILRAIYRPRKLAERQRIISRVCEEARQRFPGVRWTRQALGRFRHQMLDELEVHLAKVGLIPGSGKSKAMPRLTKSAVQGAVNARTRHTPDYPSSFNSEHSVRPAQSRKRSRRREVVFTVASEANRPLLHHTASR